MNNVYIPQTNNFKHNKFKKGGNAGIKGISFQIHMITFCLLKAFKKFRGWKLSSENQLAGKFDDVVLEWEGGAFLIQTKYRQNKNITLEELLSTNTKKDDFSLVKYLLSYHDVKTKFPVTNVIICTNARIKANKDKNEFLNSQNASSENILYCQEHVCPFYTFNETIIPLLKEQLKNYVDNLTNKDTKLIDEITTDDNIKDFLKHLQFFYDYPCEAKLKDVMEQLLLDMRSSSNGFCEISLQNIINKINDWFEQPQGDCDYITEIQINAMLSEIRSNKYCEKLDQYNVMFKNNNLMIFEGMKKIFHVSVRSGYLLHAIKIFRALQYNKKEALYIDPFCDVDVQEQVIEAFNLPRYVFLIIIWPKITQCNVLAEIYKKLKRTLDKYHYKKVVLVAKDDNELIPQLGIDDNICEMRRITFDDFSEETQRNLLKKEKIICQGNRISLGEIFGMDISNYECISAKILEKLVRNEEIVIIPATFRIHLENTIGVNEKAVMLTADAVGREAILSSSTQKPNDNCENIRDLTPVQVVVDRDKGSIIVLVRQSADLLLAKRDMIQRDEDVTDITKNAVITSTARNDDLNIKWLLEHGTFFSILE